VEESGDLLARVDNEAHVRIFGLTQRRRHADVDGVELAHYAEVGSGPNLARLHQSLDIGGRHVLDIGFAAIDRVHFGLLHVDTSHAEAGVRKLDYQRETHISQPHHAHMRLVCLNLAAQCIRMIRHRYLVHFPVELPSVGIDRQFSDKLEDRQQAKRSNTMKLSYKNRRAAVGRG